MKTLPALIKKYNTPVPRYTSYPTVPSWDNEHFTSSAWLRSVERIFDETNDAQGISLYVHLPFCESLCTYCACTTRITKNHAVEEPYLQAILTEWELYRYVFGKTPVIRELHLGGGTPTFFKPENLRHFLKAILLHSIIHADAEFSFEGHPNNTTREHLQTLYDLGFRRVSYGVQDLSEEVQQAIHRIQPFENLEKVVSISRSIGYTSINFDLIYGLPFQTEESIRHTFEQVATLRPDRIAFYSYAHVPWLKPGQRGYEDSNLPTDEAKRSLYETGKQILLQQGYHDIGMDHFALPNDALHQAAEMGTLHRNFMGYTTSFSRLLIGLGASAISDSYYGYAQNAKKVEDYQQHVSEHKLLHEKGHLLSDEDILRRDCILSISCQGFLHHTLLNKLMSPSLQKNLDSMEEEGLLERTAHGITVTKYGKPFIRNICALFDVYLKSTPAGKPVFSTAV